MALTFSEQQNWAVAGPSQWHGSTTGGEFFSTGGSMFQGTGNTQVHGGTFNVTGRDTIVNHFHAPPPDANLVSKICGWLAPKTDFRSIQIDTLKKRTPGTGTWLLNSREFQQWCRTKHGILWGTGIPGSGKTVVASIVTEYLDGIADVDAHGGIVVACAYSRYTEKISLEEILGGLVDQQLERYPTLVQFVEPLYQRHRDGRTKPSENELVDVLVMFSKQFRMSFYILDGIDEAPRTVQFNLIAMLRMIEANFFITSRPLANLESELPEAKRFKVIAHKDDILLLIDAVFARNPVLRWLLEDPAFKQEVIEKILKKSAGMFLHASLQLLALENCLSVYDIRSTLGKMPAGLDGMYATTMTRIEQQAPRHVALAKRILALVVHAEQSFSVEELQYAVIANLETHTFDTDHIVDGRSLLSVCCGLIYVEKEDQSNTVRLIHFTAKDALEPILLKDYPSPYAFLASTCISRLISCDFQESDILNGNHLNEVLSCHPFLHYAYNNWDYYARKCDPQLPASLPIHHFLEQCQSFPLALGFDNDDLYPCGSSLHIASAFGLLPFLSTIPDPNARDANNLTPLMVSLVHNPPSIESAFHLLDQPRIDVNTEAYGYTPLMAALVYDHESVVRQLLQFPEINVNATDAPDWTPLMQATWNANDGVLAALLEHPGLKVNCADTDGTTALMEAASIGRENVVAWLLEWHELEVNATDHHKMTALAHAAQNGHEDVVKQLLHHGDINIKATDKDTMSPAMLASLKGHDSIAQLLLEYTLLEGHPSPWAKLMYALSQGWGDVIQELLASYDVIPINAEDENGFTPLILASLCGHKAVVMHLLDCPAIQINLVSSNGYTALIAASERGHEQIVQCLLQAPSIDINHKKNGAALHHALRNGHSAIALELLQHPKVDPLGFDNDGRTALMQASDKGFPGVIEQLLGHPAIDVNARAIGWAYAGWTALMFATMQFPTVQFATMQPIVKLLQHPEIDVNSAANNGSTALMLAVNWGRTAIIPLFLQHPRIDVNATDIHGRTALSIASKWYSDTLDSVKLLLEFPGIDVNMRDNDGRTPLMWASYNGRLDIVKLLLEFPGIQVDVVDDDGDTAVSLAGRHRYTNIKAIRDALSKHMNQHFRS